MNRLLLDTHIAIWLENGDRQLRPSTLATLEHCYQSGGQINFSAVSAWEMAMLLYRGHIELSRPLEDWVQSFVRRPGFSPVPLSLTAALAAYRLHPFAHGGPADRLLIATAIELGCPLVTYDRRIRDFARRYGSQYRFSVMH